MRFHIRRAGVAAAALALGLAAAGCGPAETTATAFLTWQIVDAQAPDPNTAPALKCADKGVATIRLQLTPGGGAFDFPCTSMAAETQTFNAGIYSIQAIAFNASFSAVAQTAFQQRLFGRTNLGHIIFQVK